MKRGEKSRLRAKHRAKGRGRPTGKVPFSKNKNRFEIVWAEVFSIGGRAKYQAAYLTTVWLHSDQPITISQLSEQHALISAEYEASINEGGVDKLGKRAQYLVECWNEVEATIHSWRAEDRDWYFNSREALYCFLQFGVRGIFRIELARVLAHLGWNDSLKHVLGRLFAADVIPASKREQEDFTRRVLPKLLQNSQVHQGLMR